MQSLYWFYLLLIIVMIYLIFNMFASCLKNWTCIKISTYNTKVLFINRVFRNKIFKQGHAAFNSKKNLFLPEPLMVNRRFTRQTVVTIETPANASAGSGRTVAYIEGRLKSISSSYEIQTVNKHSYLSWMPHCITWFDKQGRILQL